MGRSIGRQLVVAESEWNEEELLLLGGGWLGVYVTPAWPVGLHILIIN